MAQYYWISGQFNRFICAERSSSIRPTIYIFFSARQIILKNFFIFVRDIGYIYLSRAFTPFRYKTQHSPKLAKSCCFACLLAFFCFCFGLTKYLCDTILCLSLIDQTMSTFNNFFCEKIFANSLRAIFLVFTLALCRFFAPSAQLKLIWNCYSFSKVQMDLFDILISVFFPLKLWEMLEKVSSNLYCNKIKFEVQLQFFCCDLF